MRRPGQNNKSISDREKQIRDQQRSEKWKRRGDRFWSTFLFTENGKPKSGFLIYTFCLAVVFFALYYAAFFFLVDPLASVTKGWPVWLGNLLSSLCCSAVGIVAGLLGHRAFSDKRLMLGAHIWLALLAAASIIAMAIIMKDSEAFGNFMKFALWFIIIPVVLGLAVFYILYRRDHVPAKGSSAEQEPEYKKYLRRD